MTGNTGDVETIDAPLQPGEEELVKILGEPLDGRRNRDEDLVNGKDLVDDESSPPAPDSEFFTAPLLDENDNETGR